MTTLTVNTVSDSLQIERTPFVKWLKARFSCEDFAFQLYCACTIWIIHKSWDASREISLGPKKIHFPAYLLYCAVVCCNVGQEIRIQFCNKIDSSPVPMIIHHSSAKLHSAGHGIKTPNVKIPSAFCALSWLMYLPQVFFSVRDSAATGLFMINGVISTLQL